MDSRTQGLEIAAELLTPAGAARLDGAAKSGVFGGEIAEFVLEDVFAGRWARPGLDRRARSLVTLGILISSGSDEELKNHAVIAIRNGLTVQELEEVVYHASAYAGFPAASAARAVMQAALEAAKLDGR